MTTSNTARTEWAPLPAAITGAGSNTAPTALPTAITDDGTVNLGAHSPMFLPDTIADAGLVRIGAHSPTF